MSKYFTRTSGGVMPKNKAQQTAYELRKECDGILFLSLAAKNDFKEELRRKVDVINQNHRKCTDLHVNTWKSDENTKCIGVNELFTVYIHKIQSEIE